MKHLKVILIIILFEGLFSMDYAYTLENGKRSMGIFQPRIYGLNNNIEFSTHPLLFIIKPNFRLKKFHGEIKGIGIAMRYSFDYPTQFFRLIQHRGYFGFIADDSDIGEIPHLFSLQAELLATKIYTNHSLTGKFGLIVSLINKMDSRHLIDYDLIYPRMAIFHHEIGGNVGIDWDYKFSDKISIKSDVDLLFLAHECTFIEHKFLFHYNISKKCTLSSGYKFSYGHYPFNKIGEYWWNIFPLIDLTWNWKK